MSCIYNKQLDFKFPDIQWQFWLGSLPPLLLLTPAPFSFFCFCIISFSPCYQLPYILKDRYRCITTGNRKNITHTAENTVRTHMPSYHARAHRGGLIIIRLPGRWWKNEQICQLPKETEDSSHFILSLSVYFILPLNPVDVLVGEGIYAGILSVIACVIVTMAKIMQA